MAREWHGSDIDRVVIGEEGEGDPPLMRILNRAMTPGTLLNADPLKYISDSLRRDAYHKVRQQIGDPHDGSKIRKIARELSLDEADASSPAVVDALNKVWTAKYPKADGLGPKRVENALGVVGSPKVVPFDA